MQKVLQQLLEQTLAKHRHRPRWVVAFSGGLDSTVLLHALSRLPAAPPICALHIHHGLQAEADAWLSHCNRVAQSLGVASYAERIVVEGEGEEAARRARYAVFERFLGDDDLLLQAHHLDDQIETLMLRLFRGTGLDGLQGIPAERELGEGILLRPLLTVPRAELMSYAKTHKLAWVEDPSNRQNRYDRNYLRNELLPLVEARWPGYRNALARLSGLVRDSLPDQAPGLEHSRHDSRHSVLDLEGLRALDEGERNACLRRWLSQCQLTPTLAQLQALQRAMLWSSSDAEPVFELAGWQVRRFHDTLYLTALSACDLSREFAWDGRDTLHIPCAGRLSAQQGGENSGAEDCRFQVRFRRGGERCRPAGRAHSQRLKKLLQASSVPPWRRDRLPLLYLDGELAAVSDLWVCAEFAERLAGWRFHWEPEE